MLNEDIMSGIKSGSITSRRQVYEIVGRSKALRQWMDKNGVLVPSKWSKDRVKTVLRDRFEETDKIPVAQDDWTLARAAQNHFGSWNEALYQTFGVYNQKRYDHYSDNELLDIIKNFVIEAGRLPLRSEFDGQRYPYFEAYTSRFGVSRWSEIISLVNLDGVSYYTNSHGWGKVYKHNDVTYLSREEMLIGKWLDSQEIQFDKEVPYGNSNHVFDFYLTDLDVYVEYYGIATDEYKSRIEEKRKHYNGRRVIEIFKHDNTIGKLAIEVQRL